MIVELIFIVQAYAGSAEFADKAQLILPNKKSLEVTLAITPEEQSHGLSGVRPNQMPPNQGMLFIYREPEMRRFWMPDTYFDLDIFFLDENLKVLDVERNVKHHPGFSEPPPVATTRSIYSNHVLEVSSSSYLSKMIGKGTKLEWKYGKTHSLHEFLSSIPAKN